MERSLNALLILIISGILLGAFGVQIFMHETPCPLCYLQRLGMLGVAMGAVLNLKFGLRASHYGLSLFAALTGAFVAARQIALHICPGFSTFGKPVWGLSLYTWSFIVFASSVAYIALMLFLFNQDEKASMNRWERLVCLLLVLVTGANVVTTWFQCGLGTCD